MFVTKKQHAASLDKTHYTFNYHIRNLENTNRTLNNRIDTLERDLIAIKKYLNIEFITIPPEYIAKKVE